MLDPIQLIPARFKEKLADGLVELLAGSAERLGGDQIAGNIRKLSSRGDLLQSIDHALETGIGRFIKDYMSQDEDLVETIQADDIFWQSEIVQDALVKLVGRPGAWLGEERETVLRHFETLLPQRVNRERVDKAISFLLRCIAEELWSLPGAQEIREAYSVQFQKLSAEAQREQVALARQQLQATTQLSADLRQALLQLIGLVEQKLLAAPALAFVLASPRLYHNLPHPIYTQFIGRDEELAWLRRRLSPADRAWQIAITGIGGVGKSALALAVGHEYRQHYNELPPEERFEAIVWVSAKEEVLTAFGRERANVPEQVLHTLEDVYTAIARVLEREDITRAQPDEQNALVEKALKRQRTLLIMDNLESIKDDRIKAFLRNLPPPTKALITSRESLDVADARPLTGLLWEAADALIGEECRVREIPLTPQQRKRIFELTSGLPLPIKLGIARMAGGGSFALVDRWLGNAEGELPAYCVKGQIDLVRERDPNAWAVLLACALFDREAGASRAALGEIAELSLADRDSALAQLHRLFLVNRREDDRLWVLPIIQRFVGSVPICEMASVIERWLAWLADVAQANGTQVERDASKMLGLQQEYPNLRAAIRWCRERENYPVLLQLCEGTWRYPYHAALHGELEEILKTWLDAARALKAACSERKALLQQARLWWIWERGTEALSCLDQAESAGESCGDYWDIAESWYTRSQIAETQKDYAAAIEWAQRIYDLGEKVNDADILLKGGRRHAEIETTRGNLDRARRWLDKVEPSLPQAKLYRSRISLLYRRARLLMQQEDYLMAETLLEEVVNLETELGDRRFLAADKFRLAQTYRAVGRLQAARQLAGEARSIVEGMGMQTLEAMMNKFLDELSSPRDERRDHAAVNSQKSL